MNNRNPLKALSFLLVPTALLLLSAPGYCEGPSAPKASAPSEHSGRRHNENEAHQAFSKQLGLSPEQSQKVKAIMQEGHQQSQTMKEQLRAKRKALMQYLQTPNASQSQALSMNADINATQRQMSELRLKTFFAMRAQLTPEQLQKLPQLKRPDGMGGGDGSPGCMRHRPSGSPDHKPPTTR